MKGNESLVVVIGNLTKKQAANMTKEVYRLTTKCAPNSGATVVASVGEKISGLIGKR